ncbi:unnamed protein product [Oikopleura dioica]|uniref:Uncharacterized protein n=1 Tax=Oikopleura dioica TaxID=34765 RepID=E4WXL9_OIKDI|nr:unnamed protein product [Oikopleura dioica]CBY34596.1 unnamed protein product [Oikopleura dioica]
MIGDHALSIILICVVIFKLPDNFSDALPEVCLTKTIEYFRAELAQEENNSPNIFLPDGYSNDL